jgi:hypothetical protein
MDVYADCDKFLPFSQLVFWTLEIAVERQFFARISEFPMVVTL